MTTKQEKRIAEYARLFRVKPGSKVTLADDFDPAFKAEFLKKKDGAELLRRGVRAAGGLPGAAGRPGHLRRARRACRRSTRPARTGRSGT